ncbi:MAG: hypothetical protein DRJ45_01530 [Thermoprotei archaeon]|nr:MAG: hypothetical protein DRJ45_01530 [Thermoprotei archaeon]
MFDLNVGVIGVGGVGSHHVAILKDICRFVGIYDIRKEARKNVAEKLDVKEFKSLKDLLKSVDVVFISTPPFTHLNLIKKIAEEGKHIFCEKPLSVNADEAERAVKIVRKNGIIFMMGFVLRFHPLYVKIKEILDKNILGDIVNAWFLDVRAPFRYGAGSWRLKRTLNSGIFEQTVHEIDVIRWLMGEPMKIFAFSNRLVLKDIDYEDNMVYLLKMENNSIVTLISSICSKSNTRDAGIVGSKGTLLVKENKIFLNNQPIEYEKWNAFRREDTYFLNCIQCDVKPAVNEIDGYRAQVIGEMAQKSASSGKELIIRYRY